MKKTLIKRGFLGFPLGIAIGFVISLIISIYIGDGTFHPARQELIKTMGDELKALIF